MPARRAVTLVVAVLVAAAVLAAGARTGAEDDVVALARAMMEVESLSGAEGEMAVFLETWLKARNYTVELQTVAAGRLNVFAFKGRVRETRMLLNSHIDTVPPYIAPTETSTTLSGRGSTDAKSSIAAQLVALEQMWAAGAIREGDVSVLYVVGEEVDHSGMKKANELGLTPRFLVVGEPTESKLAVGHKGMFKFTLQSQGKAAHSGYPELGKSAIVPLMEVLLELDRAAFPESELLGPTTLNVGTIMGGIAANVVPEYAEAQITTRVATPVAEVRAIVEGIVGGREGIRLVEETSNEPVVCNTLPGFETAVMAYGTDIPYFDGPEQVYLVGPGSITVAHSSDEAIDKDELRAHVQLYKDVIAAIFAGDAAA